jgi:inorganic triphosphatase YgiF
MEPPPNAPQEIELKLTLDPAAIALLRRHPALRPLRAGRARTATVESDYYDTAARELAAAGVALRLRHDGSRWLQTVKGGGSAAAGLHQRAEYEWPLAGPRLDPARFAETPWHKLLLRLAASGRLRRVFRTVIARTSQPLAFPDGSRAVLCIDVGFVQAGRRRQPLAEIEIELTAGHPQRLFDLALALAQEVPVKVATASKAERGYLLADAGAIRPPVRARTVAFAAAGSVPQALATIANDCLAQVGGNADAVVAAADREYLHQMRIGVRRLRSVFRLAAGLGDAAAAEALDGELRWLAAALGPARDWDVLVEETLPPIARSFRARRELTSIRLRAAKLRHRHGAAARDAVASPRFQRLLLGLGAYFLGLAPPVAPDGTPVGPAAFATGQLERREVKLRKAAKQFAQASPAERHRVRIAAKKLRYPAEFFAPLFPDKRGRTYIKALGRLQTALGILNDVATAERLLAELAPPSPTPAPRLVHAAGLVRGWMAATADAEIATATQAWRALGKCKPFWH